LNGIEVFGEDELARRDSVDREDSSHGSLVARSEGTKEREEEFSETPRADEEKERNAPILDLQPVRQRNTSLRSTEVDVVVRRGEGSD